MRSVLAATPVALIGVFTAHQITYERVAEAAGDHAGMTMSSQTWLPGLPALLITASLLALVLALATRSPRRAPRLGDIVAVQTTLFLVLQTADRVLHDCCAFPDAALLLTGLAAQLPTAVLAWTLTRIAIRALNFALASAPSAVALYGKPATPSAAHTQFELSSLLRVSAAGPRAPPVMA